MQYVHNVHVAEDIVIYVWLFADSALAHYDVIGRISSVRLHKHNPPKLQLNRCTDQFWHRSVRP